MKSKVALLSSFVEPGVERPHIIVVMGKGGVGKTTVSIRLAYELSRKGFKVLLASLDPAKHLLEYLELPKPLVEKEVAPNLFAVQYEVDRYARKLSEEYMVLLRRLIPALTALSADDVLKAIRDSPGFEEEVFLRILSELYERRDMDFIVVDTPPTGIALRVVMLPRVHLFWVARLRELRERIVSIRYAIANALGRREEIHDPVLDKLYEMEERYKALWDSVRRPERTSFVIVATPEPLPIYEAKMVVERIKEMGSRVKLLVVNRVMAEKAAILGTDGIEKTQIAEAKKICCMTRPPALLALISHVEKPPSRLEDVAELDKAITVMKPEC
ncbi:ArsA family ATPase [Pyrofollis japonicus]|uniref:ArsA family ATPase n=1 Tax=Pyrofollis japonicus TaxID=3060460 RepID=UPI00295C09B0|nr:ArsA family ATPase [Pyrofollis japonicus]BEP16890.1 ArsA family ATPase [Pyrofollis japonicus]